MPCVTLEVTQVHLIIPTADPKTVSVKGKLLENPGQSYHPGARVDADVVIRSWETDLSHLSPFLRRARSPTVRVVCIV